MYDWEVSQIDRRRFDIVGNYIHSFYPDLRKDEVRKYLLLAAVLFLIIGAYYLLRTLKSTIFFTLAFPQELGWAAKQGKLFQPIAAMWSFAVMFLVVLAYSKLVDKVKKQQLFYILCSIYAGLFVILSGIIFITEMFGPSTIGKLPLAITGWTSYFVIDSYGALIVALFWSFTNSISTDDSAKRGFPLVNTFAHLGAILFSLIPIFAESIGHIWPILLGASGVIFCIIPLIHYFMKTVPPDQLVGYKPNKKETKKKESFFEGLFAGITLLVTRPYLLGILIVTTFQTGIVQIVEYQMQSLANETSEWSSPLAFTKFLAIYNLSINIMSLLILLFGTRYLFRHYSIRVSVMMYPVIFGVLLVGVYVYQAVYSASHVQLLWLTFTVLMIAKSVGYAVNGPTKEILYIPTSKDAQFKTKGFIETVGSHASKASGASINNLFSSSISQLMCYGTLFGIGIALFWGVAAFLVGKKNVEVIRKGEVVQ